MVPRGDFFSDDFDVALIVKDVEFQQLIKNLQVITQFQIHSMYENINTQHIIRIHNTVLLLYKLFMLSSLHHHHD